MSRDFAASYAQQGFPKVLDDPLKLAVAYHHWEVLELEAKGQRAQRAAKEYGDKANGLRKDWKKAYQRVGAEPPAGLQALWQPIAAPVVDLNRLPWGSWTLQFTFRLRRPYLSKDERDFYIIDNPVRRERIFGMPCMAASSWKGCLRAALRECAPELMIRLCGNAKGEKNDFRQGRLRPFPSFFDQVGLEIINPHDRPRRVGTKPLDFECAPMGARATFTLLYVPFDLVGRPAGWRDPLTGENVPEAIGADLKAVADAVRLALTENGFGAKTSSGYGAAEDQVFDFHWVVHALVTQMPAEEQAPDEALETDIAAFLRRFRVAAFPRWTNPGLQQHGWRGKRASAYKRLRDRHPDWDTQARTWREPTPPPEPEIVPLTETASRFDLAELDKVAGKLAAALQEEVDHE